MSQDVALRVEIREGATSLSVTLPSGQVHEFVPSRRTAKSIIAATLMDESVKPSIAPETVAALYTLARDVRDVPRS